MRLRCDIQVSNRVYQGERGMKRKSSLSSLAIGFPPGFEKQPGNLHILLATAQNKTGTRYKVKTNVDQVLEKFVNDGMLTIRFKQPAHDLLISKADPVLLKTFLKVLRLGLNGAACDKLCFPRLTTCSTAEVQAPKTKVEVNSRTSYLELRTLPSTLTNLRLNNCELKLISERISKLHRLKCLNVNNNEIAEIPLEIGRTNLAELHLANNRIGAIKAGLFASNFINTLRMLDLSHNRLLAVPPQICNLEQLVTLKLSNNQLTSLPDNIWMLKKLKHFSAFNNCLSLLPGTLTMLKLENIDVSGNPLKTSFDVSQRIDATKSCNSSVPTLLEWASRSILKFRLVYGKEDLPFHLIHDLASFKKCLCGRLFIESSICIYSMIDLSLFSNTIFYSTDNWNSNFVPIRTELCSSSCIATMKSANYVC